MMISICADLRLGVGGNNKVRSKIIGMGLWIDCFVCLRGMENNGRLLIYGVTRTKYISS